MNDSAELAARGLLEMSDELDVAMAEGDSPRVASLLEDRKPLVDRLVALASRGEGVDPKSVEQLLRRDQALEASLVRFRDRLGEELRKIAQVRTAARGYASVETTAGAMVNVEA